MRNINIVIIILLFSMNSYSSSWLSSINVHVDNYYDKNPKPDSIANIKFKVESDKNPSLNYGFKNNSTYTPTYDQKFIGGKDNYKKIDVCINKKCYLYGQLIDKGNWLFLFKYHPANYDSNGNLNYEHPFIDDYWVAQCIVGTPDDRLFPPQNLTDANLVLSISGAFFPILQSNDHLNRSSLDLSFCNVDQDLDDFYVGAYASLYIDKPNALYFYGNKPKTVTEKLLERVYAQNNSATSGVTIKKIFIFNNKQPNLNKAIPFDLLKVDPKKCLSKFENGVNCKFDVIYTPQNAPFAYSGYIYVYYTTKLSTKENVLSIPFTINSDNSVPVQGKILSNINHVKEGSCSSVTFQFTNTGNKPITNIKLKDEVPSFVSRESSCPSKLLPNESCKVTVVFRSNHFGRNIISTIFSYNEGPPVDLSLSVSAI